MRHDDARHVTGKAGEQRGALACIGTANLERCPEETKEAGAAARDKAVREAVRLLVRSR